MKLFLGRLTGTGMASVLLLLCLAVLTVREPAAGSRPLR